MANFRRVADADFCTPTKPAFMLGPIPTELVSDCWDGHGFQWVHEQGVLEIDATMHAPYLLTRDGAPVEFTWANLHSSYLDRIWQPKPETQRPSDVVRVLIAGPGHPIFGHWLVDFLPKLWVLSAAGYDIDALRYVVPGDTPDFGIDLLHLCGLHDIERLRDDECLRGTFLVPTTVHNGLRGPLLFDAANFLRKRLGLAVQKGGTKLMLSRVLAPETRGLGNRDVIERAAAAAGYSIVCPERLSLVEQFRLAGGAAAVIGEYGSALHSTLFSGSGTVVAGLRGTGLHPGFVQSAIGDALRQPTGYLFAERQPNDAPEGFSIPEGAFQELLSIVDERIAFSSRERAARALWGHYNIAGLDACRDLAMQTIRDIEDFEHERRQHTIALDV
jgi:hypothetical protein